MNTTLDTQIDTSVVAIVDDDEAVREGLALLLRTVGLQTRCYPDANSFLADAGDGALGCALFDIRMPGMSGLDLLDHVSSRYDLPIVVMSGHGNIDSCRRAFKGGALDFLRKPVDDDELIGVVQQAIRKRRRQSDGHDAQQVRAQQVRAERIATLSAREKEVFDGIVSGLSNKEIARNLGGLSPRTVETYRANVFDKLQMRSVVELVRTYAVGPDAATAR